MQISLQHLMYIPAALGPLFFINTDLSITYIIS